MSRRRLVPIGLLFVIAGVLVIALFAFLPNTPEPVEGAPPAYVGDNRSGEAAYWVGTVPNTVECDAYRVPDPLVVVPVECDADILLPDD